MPSISAFFPAYNDAGTIPSMVMATDIILRGLTDDYEIIVVNDGSKDHTQEMLEELQTKYDHLRVVRHERNRGYGGALRSGFASATKDLVFYTDGDAQYDPREIKLLIDSLRDDVDVVNGYKIARNDPLHRIIIGRLYHRLMRFAFSLKLRDVDCDFRLIRRHVFDRVQLESNSGLICVELMKKIQDNGFKIEQVPVHHFHRAYGTSQFFNFRRLAQVAIGLTGLWWKLVVKKEVTKSAPAETELDLSRQIPSAFTKE
jgi:glycosyltransferase involved in cell wall biosynthesis